tara:strand:+ start:490 stop:1407 length:918 start_codon:yes stop_codon:yes gene_type:complete
MKSLSLEGNLKFGNLELLAKQVVEGFITGLHKSPFHGFSVEFAEHRIYNVGESTRHIDWKLFARTDKLFTKKYEEETNLRCQFVIDTSSSMYFPQNKEKNKLEHAILSCVCLMELLKKQRDAVGLSLISDQIDLHTKAKSSATHLRFILSKLEECLYDYSSKNKRKTDIIKVLHDLAETTHRRSMFVIFSDLLDDPEKVDDLFQALEHMKHNKHEVILFHTVDKQLEVDFDLGNKPHKLIDMETGEEMKVEPAEIRESYKKEINKYFNEIEMRCLDQRIEFMPVDIHENYDAVLLRYLLKRQKLN